MVSRKGGDRKLIAQPLAAALDNVLKPTLSRYSRVEAELLVHWDLIVGKKFDAICRPEKVFFSRGKKQNGTLTLYVSAMDALDIQHSTPQIIEKIAVYFGYKVIAHIKIHQVDADFLDKKSDNVKPSSLQKNITKNISPSSGTSLPAYNPVKIEGMDDELCAALNSLGSTLKHMETKK